MPIVQASPGGGYSLSRGAAPGLLNPDFGYDKHASLPLYPIYNVNLTKTKGETDIVLSDASSDIRRAWLTMLVKIFPGN